MPVTEAELRAAAAEYAGGEDDDFSESVLRRLRARQAAAGKQCATCGITKPLRAFTRDSRQKDGLLTRCRECYNRARRLQIGQCS